jgi:hypothetical protein
MYMTGALASPATASVHDGALSRRSITHSPEIGGSVAGTSR